MTALFGGSFDPIHQGHLTIARAAVKLGYDPVVLIPSGTPPHKPLRTPFEHRLAMARLVWSPVSDVEGRPGRSYTFDTLQHFPEPRAFVIGADAFAEIETWHRWQEVLTLTEFLVVSRPRHRYRVPPGARVRRLESLAIEISSSSIREQLRLGGNPEGLPEPIYDYIRKHGLYQP